MYANILKTITDRGSVPKDHQQENGILHIKRYMVEIQDG